jgi:hypothetical protein
LVSAFAVRSPITRVSGVSRNAAVSVTVLRYRRTEALSVIGAPVANLGA